jgi:hypothetical protein
VDDRQSTYLTKLKKETLAPTLESTTTNPRTRARMGRTICVLRRRATRRRTTTTTSTEVMASSERYYFLRPRQFLRYVVAIISMMFELRSFLQLLLSGFVPIKLGSCHDNGWSKKKVRCVYVSKVFALVISFLCMQRTISRTSGFCFIYVFCRTQVLRVLLIAAAAGDY